MNTSQAPQGYAAKLRASLAARATVEDLWCSRLRAVRGAKGTDGVERVSTEKVYDTLELHPFERTPEAGKRVRAIMIALDWTPIRSRCVTSKGHAARVRGYARLAFSWRRSGR